mmetsp:Transcript_18555/g.25719  ORF Transcript_18555/g.25719 Transcript_18555/m.25719 type:complete len:164 (-) Transcript_18555:361-852(-)|eukprot:CAMPEP_0196572298 /NCGR_PEP_ID=MMETSP1081-20130531/2372_1 /TAXON_ID=36882 /ORGANISM="Pyramimonas amylifera, Strain CCMP720" /LENGTH=163 /DNA_ID=CAMNT_0041889573 /DNA_START=163 /DNA_END=654 /DNA_ORIENTATION=+
MNIFAVYALALCLITSPWTSQVSEARLLKADEPQLERSVSFRNILMVVEEDEDADEGPDKTTMSLGVPDDELETVEEEEVAEDATEEEVAEEEVTEEEGVEDEAPEEEGVEEEATEGEAEEEAEVDEAEEVEGEVEGEGETEEVAEEVEETVDAGDEEEQTEE